MFHAVAIRNMQLMEEEELFVRSAQLGERLLGDLSGLEDHPSVGDVRGKGLLIGIELVSNKETKEPAGAERVAAAMSGCKERGLVVANNADTVAGFNNVLTLSPPLSITEEDLDFIVQTLRGCFEQL